MKTTTFAAAQNLCLVTKKLDELRAALGIEDRSAFMLMTMGEFVEAAAAGAYCARHGVSRDSSCLICRRFEMVRKAGAK